MTTLADQLTMRRAEPGDEDAILNLLKVTMGESETLKRTSELWRWKHVNNIFGPSYVQVACAPEDGIVGLRAFMQWRFNFGGRSISAVRAVDTATHPKYQRMGIFSNLTKRVVEDVKQDGVPLIFNTPNQLSMPGYLKMGWSHVGVFHPMVRVLNTRRFLFGLIRSRMKSSDAPPYPHEAFFRRPLPEAAAILDDASGIEPLLSSYEDLNGVGAIFTPRSADYIRWRYAQHPYITYRAATVGADGHPQACAIFRTNTRFGLKEVVLSEVLLGKPDEKACRALVKQLKSSLKADYLIAYARDGSFLRHALKRSGFRAVPRFGMDFTARPLSPDIGDAPLQLSNWAPSLGDLELF